MSFLAIPASRTSKHPFLISYLLSLTAFPVTSLQDWRLLSQFSPPLVLARHHGPGHKGTALLVDPGETHNVKM